MTKQIRNTVRAAQLLQSLGGTGGSPLDALFSFLEPVLSDFSGQEFDPYLFAEAVRDAYGWDFNEDVADGLRRPLRVRGWLQGKKTQPNNLPVYVDGKPVEIISYQPDPERFEFEDSIDDVLDRILRAFHEFLREINIDHGKFLCSDDEIIDTLVTWLLDNGTSPTDADDFAASDDAGTDDDQKHYLIARFVQILNERNADLSQQLRSIAAVGLLSELAQDFHKPLTSVKKSSLTVYLDSPVALDLLGASGDETAELTRSIISKLQSIGAKIAVFGSSVREMQTILDALLNANPNDRFGPSQEAIRRGEIDTAFLSAIRNDPSEAFKVFRVSVKPIGFERALKPDHHFPEGQYYKLYDLLLNTQINQREKEKRCRHDAQAIAWVMRLRKGHEHHDIFESHTVFLTRNRMFSSLSRNFCLQHRLMDEGCVAPMVNMHDLAASLWLRTGLHNEVDIPKRQLLVGCQRVLALKRPVVAQAQRAILSLRRAPDLSEDSVRKIEAVLKQDRSLTLISDRVRGAHEILDDKALLEVAQMVMADEQQKGYFQGVSEYAAEKAELAKALGEARGYSEVVENERKGLATQLADMRAAQRRRAQDLVNRFNYRYQRMRRTVRFILAILAVGLVVLSLFKELISVFGATAAQTINLQWVIAIGAVIPVLLTFLDQMAKLTGQERIIDKYVIDPWARSKLYQMCRDAGFDLQEVLTCAVPPLLPLERTFDDFGTHDVLPEKGEEPESLG